MFTQLFVLFLVSIVSIAALELTALLKGMNGVTLSLALSAIGGIAGYGIKSLRR